VKRSLIAIVSLAALAGSAQLAAAQAAPTKIGVVNVQALLQGSPELRAAQQALETEFGTEQREIQTLGQNLRSREEKLQRDRATMTAAQVSAEERALREGYIDLEARQNKAQDRLNERQNQEMQKLNRAVLEEVQKYARANSFDLILADGVLFATAALDITAPVLQALQSRSATAPAPAPAPAPSTP
jgi:outer membrane protein